MENGGGKGIQRGYGLEEKRFSLFNTGRWVKMIDKEKEVCPPDKENCPECCYVVPILHKGIFQTEYIEGQLLLLKTNGSQASPGFMNPEGIVIYHIAGGYYFKKTILNDEKGKDEKK